MNDVTGPWHPSVTPEEKTPAGGLIDLVATLFPGINYYSITGFASVMHTLAIPTLKKLYPELVGVSVESVDADDMIDVQQFLPSEGYEWQDNGLWKTAFQERLAA